MRFLEKFATKLTKFEVYLWLFSILVIVISSMIFRSKDSLSVMDSLIGVTALIFVAKGNPLGQLLTIIFALLYGVISLENQYYGEMITYVFMSAPIALFTMIEWLRHPYQDTAEAEVQNLNFKKILLLFILTILVTGIFYFILKVLKTAQLEISTISIATSFAACFLLFLRSPYYAVAYSLNDIVLIILWTIASFENTDCVPVTVCFMMFLLNDMYGFYSWKKMQKRQQNQP